MPALGNNTPVQPQVPKHILQQAASGKLKDKTIVCDDASRRVIERHLQQQQVILSMRPGFLVTPPGTPPGISIIAANSAVANTNHTAQPLISRMTIQPKPTPSSSKPIPEDARRIVLLSCGPDFSVAHDKGAMARLDTVADALVENKSVPDVILHPPGAGAEQIATRLAGYFKTAAKRGEAPRVLQNTTLAADGIPVLREILGTMSDRDMTVMAVTTADNAQLLADKLSPGSARVERGARAHWSPAQKWSGVTTATPFTSAAF